jgi:hypothetical protein
MRLSLKKYKSKKKTRNTAKRNEKPSRTRERLEIKRGIKTINEKAKKGTLISYLEVRLHQLGKQG